jgi:hypothetical protein
LVRGKWTLIIRKEKYVADCFVAMPITTSDASMYNGDGDHFSHILEHLFMPAIRAAGMTPIPPITRGAELIHADIVRNIERCDLVLCDVSSLNANVFFELGLRTALNKPVCIVKDNLTTRIPFDTTLINHYTYDSSLQPWVLPEQIKRLTEHINATVARSEGKNALWKYFGLVIPGEPTRTDPTLETRLAFLSQQLESLTRQVTDAVLPALIAGEGNLPDARGDRLIKTLVSIATAEGYFPSGGGWGGDAMSLKLDRKPTADLEEKLKRLARQAGFNLHLGVK